MSNKEECSRPEVRHLFIEGMHSYLTGVSEKPEWFHWVGEELPKPGDFLQRCDKPSWPEAAQGEQR